MDYQGLLEQQNKATLSIETTVAEVIERGVITIPLRKGQDVIQGQFLSGD